MKVAVWDTYVKKQDGGIMHFDIVVPECIKEEEMILRMGREYLASKSQQDQQLTSKECRLCHQETAMPEMEAGILSKGYYIIEMEGCE